MSNVGKYLQEMLNEGKKWSGKVEEKWHPEEGFFTQSAEKIARGLKNASDSLKQATGRLEFYINRAGKNLSAEDKARLNLAQKKLHAMYECVNETSREPVTAKDADGKKYRIYNMGTNWVALIPAKGEVSDKIKVPVGDFWEEYTAYDVDGKKIKGMRECATKPGMPKQPGMKTLKEKTDENKKRPGESNKEAAERIGKQNEKKGAQERNIKEYK